MRKKLVAGNWKMNGTRQTVIALVQMLRNSLDSELAKRTLLLPSAIYLPLVSDMLADCAILTGAQNIYPAEAGAFTGEISTPMVTEYGCQYILVGHSERRMIFHEDENFITQKFHHVKDHGMIPVLCVGETQKERELGLTESVIRRQVMAVADAGNRPDCFSNCVIAYEPVWAIGTGVTATPEQAQDVHALIRSVIADVNAESAACTPLLYGGSVTEKNARALFSMPDIDGGLVGGASLDAARFVEIIKCTS